MIWLAMHFPLLPLESLSTKNLHTKTINPQKTSDCKVVIENNLVFCASAVALQQGIKTGDKISHALALCSEVVLLKRQIAQEQLQLNSLTLILYQFSPAISIQAENLIVMEISRSLKLFGGFKHFLHTLKTQLNLQALTYQLGVGHSPKSAHLLCFKPPKKALLLDWMTDWITQGNDYFIQQINQQVNQLAINLMPLAEKDIENMMSIGLKKIGDISQLPLAAIRKRFGGQVYSYLVKLWGKAADPVIYFVPAESFYQEITFMDVIYYRQALLFPIKRLLNNFCCFLRARQKICQQFYWQIHDSEKNYYPLTIVINHQQIDENIYFQLTELQLQKYQLKAPVESISLKAEKFSDFIACNPVLFFNSEAFKATTYFIDKIKARLGLQTCYQFKLNHQPLAEIAFEKSYIIEQPYAIEKANVLKKTNASPNSLTLPARQPNNTSDTFITPLWLFNHQQKLSGFEQLSIISSAEKIATHWWQKKTARIYFLAESSQGIIYWVFYDELSDQWFVQGIYS